MIDHAIKEVIELLSRFNRPSKCPEVELKASITSTWLSSERDSVTSL